MAPGTHALIGWWTANVLPLSRRDRFLVFLGGVLPDLDGLGLLVSREAYATYHHVLLHNLFACLAWAALVGVFAADRRVAVLQSVLNWHLHLACDYFGSRGPPGSPPWVLPYLYPLVGGWEGGRFAGPAWYWNPWQWPLNGWPNILITLLALAGWVYIAIRLDRTWFEFVWPRLDPEFCRLLRRRLRVKREPGLTPFEAKAMRRTYLAVTVAAVLACVVAAARS
jgi:hypothetical protein